MLPYFTPTSIIPYTVDSGSIETDSRKRGIKRTERERRQIAGEKERGIGAKVEYMKSKGL